ncbi:MAG: hypothetical protein F4W96_03940 [Chloroflexi bacterium]|nr:hypothetical protein [Chloroflexota bacterium]
MKEMRSPAVRLQQGKRMLFMTQFAVRDLISENFYKVDRLDVQGGSGMQRLLNQSRARSFSRDILAADKYNEAFLPTSVFLATNGSISFDEKSKEIFFSGDRKGDVFPFDVVDGQHRLEGLGMAARENPRILDFPVAVVIAHQMSEAREDAAIHHGQHEAKGC